MTLTSMTFIYVYLPISLLVYYILPSGWRTAVLLAVSFGYIFAAQNIGMGLLVFTVSGLEVLLSPYKNKRFGFKNTVHFLLHCAFFPKLYAGPLQPYDDFSRQLDGGVRLDYTLLAEGFGRFSLGALKLLLPGRYLMEIYGTMTGLMWVEESMLTAWLVVLTFALGVYYHLSGLSDMAQGVGAMFGLRLAGNFYYPYQSRSVGDFVQRFNSTVWSFLRRAANQLFPAKLSRTSDVCATMFCGVLFGVWLGLWMGVRTEFIWWGIYIGCLLLLEQYAFAGAVERIPMLFRRMITLILVLLGFSLIAGGTMEQGLRYLRMMFKMDGVMFAGDEFMYLLSTRWLILLFSLFFATNICGLVADKLKKAVPRVYSALSIALGTGALIWVTALQS